MKKIIIFPISLMVASFAMVAINKNIAINYKTVKAEDENSFTPAKGSQTLRVLNWEDYIYEFEDEGDAPDLVEQFEEYARGFGFDDVELIYETTDTCENMYSELLTGKAQYDLICPSDYMIQRMCRENLLYEFTDEDKALVPNYFGNDGYASEYTKSMLDEIFVETSDGEVRYMEDYAVGYMWGTLGLLFNPEYKNFNVDADTAIRDLQTWNVLWNKTYKGTISVKDSMRDTYAAGIMYTYKEELADWQNKYEDGQITLEEYQTAISSIFNRSDEQYVEEVKESLNKMKKNIFGLEVDSGKQDIVTGKIGINLAWSGDAVYSMDQGEDEEQVGDNIIELCYSIPELGSNVWFDGWVMPKLNRDESQKQLALLFLNFLCDPENAAQNMDYIGYTSFIGGEPIRDLVRDWYDVRTDDVYYEDYDVYYFDGNDYQLVDYDTYFLSNIDELQDYPLFYEEEGSYLPIYLTDEDGEETQTQKTIADLADLSEYEEVNLDYYFDSSCTDQSYTFYSDCYLPFESQQLDPVTGEPLFDDDGEPIMEQNVSVGRQFFAQYPNFETISRCCVMKDYGKNNALIMRMWEDFKSDALPTWAIILFSVEGAGLLFGVSYFVYNKARKKKLKLGRKEK